MLKIKPNQVQYYPPGYLGQETLPAASPSYVTTISNNAVPFILGMVTWAVLGNTLKDLFGLGEVASGRVISAARSKIEKK